MSCDHDSLLLDPITELYSCDCGAYFRVTELSDAEVDQIIRESEGQSDGKD